MHTVLWQRGVQVSIRTVYRVMKMAGLLHKKRMPHSIRKADTETQERDNLIKQVFHVDEPLKKLLTDITEMPFMDGRLYVSPIMDCFKGEIVALERRENMKKELCVDTLQQLKNAYGKLLFGAILHSGKTNPTLGKIMYCTGGLARQRADGEIEYLG